MYRLDAKAVVLLPALLLPMLPLADEHQPPGLPRVAVTPFGGYAFGGEFDGEPGGSAEVEDSAHLGVVVDIREGPNTQWEIFYSVQQTDADTSAIPLGERAVDLDIQYLQLGGTYVADGNRARPFLAATIGATRFDPDPVTFDSENFFSFSVGAGWYFDVAPQLDLRLEGRALGTFLGSDTDLFCRTGPDRNVCAIKSDSEMFWQLQTSLGFAFRF